LPVIVVAGPSEVQTAVDALKAGVVDFLEKPIGRDVLLASIERALVRGREAKQFNLERDAATDRLLKLTPRQRQVMDLIVAGHPSKNIAADIGVSQRTVEGHRAEVMRRMGARSMPALVRLAVAAAVGTPAPLSFDFGQAEGQLAPSSAHADRTCAQTPRSTPPVSETVDRGFQLFSMKMSATRRPGVGGKLRSPAA